MTRATRYREEGVGQPQITTDWQKKPPISAGDVGATMRGYYASFSRHFRANERVYANVRAQAGLSPKPRYIISDIGIVSNNGINKDKFSWVYLPPVAGKYNVTPRGVVRPWTFLFMHSFGYVRDYAALGLSGNRSLQKRLVPPGDEYGHDPKRWFAGIKEVVKFPGYIKGKVRPVSIHFCISRRGDVVVSTDLNDIAWHGGGRLLDAKKRNNTVSVGFELEPQLHRFSPGAQVRVTPFTQPQMIALAIVCKKLTTWRPIKQVYITRRNATTHKDFAHTLRLAVEHGSGYVQHSDVSPVYTNNKGKKVGGKSDAGGQFNILPGEKARIGSSVWKGTGTNASNGTGEWVGSGWTELWGYMDRVRRFRAADQLFVASIPDVDFPLMTEFAEALQRSNSGQRAVLLSAQDRIAGLRRAANMQSRNRRATYAKAMTHGTSLSETVARTTAAMAKTLAALELSLPKPTGEVMTYNYDTGTWAVSGTDSGSG